MAAFEFDPFRHKSPPLFDATADSILDETRSLIQTTISVCDALVKNVQPEDASFENTIRPIVEDDNVKSSRANHIRFYSSTSPNKELRDASNKAAGLFSDADTDTSSRRDLFALIDSVMRKAGKTPLSVPGKQAIHYLRKLHQQFIANGCGIEDDVVRREFVTKKKKQDDLARQCRKNMANEKTGLWLTREELEGVPDSLLERLTTGDAEKPGHLWLPTKVPFSSPAITNAKQESTRKKIHYAIVNRMPGNVPLIREMTLLRDETARMLGFPNHFAFKTSQKMVGSPEVVQKLLAELQHALEPAAQQLTKGLLDVQLLELEPLSGQSSKTDKVFFWDQLFLQKKRDQRKWSEDVPTSEYFELYTTLHKLLQMYEHLFGVIFIQVDTAAPDLTDQSLVWHEDVMMFSAWNVDASEPEFLGYSYMDLFPRDGKYTHVGQYNLQKGYLQRDGTWFKPCSCLVMNYLKPTDNKPTLLDLQEVRSLFHELGHMYHHLLSRAQFAALHSVDSDFVETPSLMLEQFFWDPQIIRDVSFHYSQISPKMHELWLSSLRDDQTTTECQPQLSVEQARELAQSHHANTVRNQINNLSFAVYDMLIHSPDSHEELEKMNFAVLFNKTRSELHQMHGGEAVGDGWEYGQGQSVFRAIQGKYDAGYYAYILGRIYGLDIFSVGFSGDLMNKENARRYRDMVLCKGGSQPEMKTLTDYLGREPSISPFLEWVGVGRSEGI